MRQPRLTWRLDPLPEHSVQPERRRAEVAVAGQMPEGGCPVFGVTDITGQARKRFVRTCVTNQVPLTMTCVRTHQWVVETRRNNMNRILIDLANRYRELGRDTDDTGGVAAEYGVLLAGVVAVVAIAAAALGTRIGGLFDGILP